jgi:hypothetical protein
MERTTHDALKTIVKKLPAGQFSGRGHVEDKGLDTKINDNPFLATGRRDQFQIFRVVTLKFSR